MRQAFLLCLLAFFFEFNVSLVQCIGLHKLTKIKDVALAHRHSFHGTNATATNSKPNRTGAGSHKNGKGNGRNTKVSSSESSVSAVSAASVANIGSIVSVAIGASTTGVASSLSAVSAANAASAASAANIGSIVSVDIAASTASVAAASSAVGAANAASAATRYVLQERNPHRDNSNIVPAKPSALSYL